LNQVNYWQNSAARVNSRSIINRRANCRSLLMPSPASTSPAPDSPGIGARLDYAWRVFATGFSFAAFGLGGISLGLSLVLFLFPLPLSLQWKYRIIRHLLSKVFAIYLFFLHISGLLTHEFKGLERLNQPGQLVIANHPSLLDVVFLISLVKRANCVIKQGVRENLFTFIPSKIAGYITNADKNMMAKCKESLVRGDTLIIFPEGTRTTPGQPLKLMRGVANIAIASQKNITPVLIRCAPPTLIKGQKWYDIPATPPHFSIEVLADINIEPYLRLPYQSKAARQLTRTLEETYSKQLEQKGI